MDNESNSNTTFSRLNQNKEHLKPLSVYSRMVMCNRKDSPRSLTETSDPFVNLKIKISNDGGKKRKLVDYEVRHDYSSPCKKQFSSNLLSPDFGCFMDYSSSVTRSNSMSPFAPPDLTPEARSCRSETKQTVSSRLDSEHVNCGCSRVEVEKTETILKIMSSGFDHDVEEILCLNPPKLEVSKPTSKQRKPDGGVVEDDKGYVSLFHLHETEECNIGGSPEVQGHEQASARGQHFSFLVKDGSDAVDGLLLGPLICDGDFLEGEEEVLNIGQPIFESSICQPAAGVERKSVLSEALRKHDLSQTCNSGDFAVGTLYETTLPLQVQEKSKVVVPGLNKPSSSIENEEKVGSRHKSRAESARRHRPKILDNSMEWEHQKKQYIFSVRGHLNENPGGAQGPMTELLDLMTHVAGQTGSNGSQWQHPSDLTCRNYQKRFGNEMPAMTLSEWQARNQTYYRRFSKIPKIFKRSQFP